MLGNQDLREHRRPCKEVPGPDSESSRARRRPRRRSAFGFTLVELMVVLGVLGALAAFAIPNMLVYSYKARRAEAITGLQAIWVHEESFFREWGRYGDTFDEIGMPLSGATQTDERTIEAPFYTFTVFSLSQNGVPGANFQAFATGDLVPGDGVLDVLMIENDLTVIE